MTGGTGDRPGAGTPSPARPSTPALFFHPDQIEGAGRDLVGRRSAGSSFLAGWLAHAEVGVFGVPDTFASPIDPTFVEDAAQARQTAQLRARMVSQRPTPSYDRADIEAATGIRLPDLPAGWTVRDVQVFPAHHGAGVEVAIDAGSLGEVSLFATHRKSGAREKEVVRSSDGTTAYWTAGGSTYALSGARDAADLRQAAASLAAETAQGKL